MYLNRMVYCSELVEKGSNTLESILATARRNNQLRSISGMLLFNSTFFFQCIEGSRGAINETYYHIIRDPRHKNLLILSYEEIAQRLFPSWSMAYLPFTKEVQQIIQAHTTDNDFNPYQMSAASAINLLVALKDKIRAD